MTDTERLNELRRLAGEATAGEWLHDWRGYPIALRLPMGRGADFYTELHNALPWLLDLAADGAAYRARMALVDEVTRLGESNAT